MGAHRAASLLCAAVLVASCGAGAGAPVPTVAPTPVPTSTPAPTPSPTPEPTASPGPSASPSPSRVETGRFASQLLGREMPYYAYLPAGYDAQRERRYPVLYMLHGMSGSSGEWLDIGLVAAADLVFGMPGIEPFIVVLPQGDQAYWMDHANGGPRWGTYVAREVVATIDTRYRTLARRGSRAVGGLSMGGHGALQLSLNFPDVFGVAGAHSPTIRREDQALVFFGKGADFAARDPESLVRAKPDVARRLAIWIDIAATDSWAPAARSLHALLDQLSIPHEWRSPPGDHSNEYWTLLLPGYLRFYAQTFAEAR